MYAFIVVVHVFVSMVLIIVILMQAGRGGGVSEMFGGSSTQTIFGTSATKFLMRATAVCAILFIVTSLSLAVLSSGRSRSLIKPDIIMQPIRVDETAGTYQEKAAPAGLEKGLVESGQMPPVATEETKGASKEDVMATGDDKEPVKPKSE